MSMRNWLFFVFFSQPVALGAWLPRIPEVQEKLALSPAELAIALIGAPIGTLSSLLVAGRIGDWLGAQKTMLIFYPLFFLAMTLPFLANSQLTLMLSLAVMGSTLSILELGMNVSADLYEKQRKKLVMSRAHGLWSLGLMTGTIVGSASAAVRFDPFLMEVAIFAVLILPSLYAVKQVNLDQPAPAATANTGKTRFTMPHILLLGICLFTFGTTLTEGAVADWAAIFMRDIHGASHGFAGLSLTFFTMSVALTRLTGDKLREHFSTTDLARTLAIIGVMGLGVIYIAPNAIIAMLGFAMLGSGVALGFPLAVTAAANAPGKSSASNVAVLSFLALTGFLVGPISIGFVAEVTNIKIGLMVITPMLAVSAVLASTLKPSSSHTETSESQTT
ncbi:MFS transporter [Maritalea sp. S77]|uniref:MFS transporter n=1 Tax=Maritalea sp. S77 TaxID=3415125 RepID=UPI003C7A3011